MKLAKLNKSHFILFFSFLLLVILVYAVQTLTLEIDDKTEFAGALNVSIPVILTNNVSVAGFQFNINHTPYLIFKGVEKTSRMVNSTVEVNDVNGQIRIAALIENYVAPGNESVMSLMFDVNESAVAGSYPLQAESIIIADINTQVFSTDSLQGTFIILVDSDDDGIDDSSDSCPSMYGCFNFSGCGFGLKEWLPPISTQEEFDLQQGATLPLKFSAANCSGIFYSDNGINVRVVNESLGIDKVYNSSGEGSDYIRINSTDEYYITNINTNELNMSLGVYDVYALFSNGLNYAVGFELVQQGPSNGKGKGLQK